MVINHPARDCSFNLIINHLIVNAPLRQKLQMAVCLNQF